MSSECSEDNLPLVTIITPTYNSNPQYLKEAIESVLEQTYPKIEYIITDDGSSVFHEELIHELLEGRNRSNITWKIIRHAENIGTVKNMNNAIRESHGEYIFPLAHDDVYYDNKVIEEWVSETKRYNCDILIGRNGYIDENDYNSISTWPRNIDDINNLTPYKKYKKVLQNPMLFPAMRCISRKCIDKYGCYDTRYKLIEDWSYALIVLKEGGEIKLWTRDVVKCHRGGVSNYKGSMNIKMIQDERRIYCNNLRYVVLIKKNIPLLFYVTAKIMIKSLKIEYIRLKSIMSYNS